jgi:hypothetical protein
MRKAKIVFNRMNIMELIQKNKFLNAGSDLLSPGTENVRKTFFFSCKKLYIREVHKDNTKTKKRDPWQILSTYIRTAIIVRLTER